MMLERVFASPSIPTSRAQRAQENARFRTTIQTIVADLDGDPSRAHEMPHLYQKYQIKRRRFYDVINVFLALGCATRGGFEELVWHGRSRIFTELREAKARLGIDNYALPLSQIFPPESCVSITSLTSGFLLLFAAVQTETLDLRKVSAFFARETDRYKSTLCKMYQIALILGALGITERTENQCEVRLLPPFTQLLTNRDRGHPLAIENLLNRRVDMTPMIQARLQELDRTDN
jgi:hypothetical protein